MTKHKIGTFLRYSLQGKDLQAVRAENLIWKRGRQTGWNRNSDLYNVKTNSN